MRNYGITNMHVPASQTVFSSLQILCEWLEAKNQKQKFHHITDNAGACNGWHKPPSPFLKCNVDAAIFTDSNASCCPWSCVARCIGLLANETAHVLTRESRYNASPTISFFFCILSCISHLMANFCSSDH